LPTINCLVLRRSASTGGGVAGIPSMTPSLMISRLPTAA
jgi:hypothetical protein